MKALVLTVDRHRPFAEHMVASYQRHWPDHPFTFRIAEQATVPWGLTGAPVEFVRSPAPIRPTLEALVEDLDDDEWIWWCIDDKYLVDLDLDAANRSVAWVRTIDDPTIAGLSFARCRRLLRSAHVRRRDRLVDPDGGAWLRRRDFSQIWLHQFLRVKVVRTLLSGMPDEPFAAKQMDGFKDVQAVPSDQRLYVRERNAVVLGESTTRGLMTANCAESFQRLGRPMPEGFDLSDQVKLMGRL